LVPGKTKIAIFGIVNSQEFHYINKTWVDSVLQFRQSCQHIQNYNTYANDKHAMTKPVRDIMTKEVITIDINQGAAEAARLMADKHISSVVVLEEEIPIGIITERDFVKKICAKELEISKIKAGEIMSRIRTFADPETSIDVAIQRMLNHNIRRLPIMSEGKTVGIITVTDLAKYLRTDLLLQGALASSKPGDPNDLKVIDKPNRIV
jgi:CBS domain-containing protein